ncbi:MAG TPA: hypothetical protein VEW48_16740 [Thermoanaerobaculia bacterium]|nr:hypothetical protein [Thermoanaerobaculia bacterium]
MKPKATLCLMLVLFAALAGCRERTDRREGTVLLSITDFDGLPLVVSASASTVVQADEIVLRNVPKDPTGTTSDLQSIEIRSYEIRFVRRDTGTKVPPSLVQGWFGLVPVGGNATLNNVPILMADQMLNPPILDLARNGVDRETGTAVIVLDCYMRFFGRTLSGDDIASDPARFTIEVRP